MFAMRAITRWYTQYCTVVRRYKFYFRVVKTIQPHVRFFYYRDKHLLATFNQSGK